MAEINNDHRTKKKNVSDSLIFEVDLDDCSPEQSPKNDLSEESATQKPVEYGSQDSGIYSQERNTSSQGSEFFEYEISQEDNRISSISHTVEKQEIIVEDTNSNLKGVDVTDCSVTVTDDVCQTTKTIDITDGKETTTSVRCVENTVAKTTDIKTTENDHLNIDGMDSDHEEGEVLDESNNISTSSIISISFKDAIVAKEYKQQFIKFLRALPELNIIETDTESLTLHVVRDSDLTAENWIVMDETLCDSEKTRTRKRKRSERKKEKDLFMVDTNPSITTKANVSLKYTSKFSVTDNEDDEKVDDVVKSAGATCFNCDGNHSLKDCTEPKNYTKINMARNSFRSSQTKSGYVIKTTQLQLPNFIYDTLYNLFFINVLTR